MKRIINLTQHPATPEQIEAGVVDLPEEARTELRAALTFDEPPTTDEIQRRAAIAAGLIADEPVGTAIMIGGAPYLMSALEYTLQLWDYRPVYAFSVRESVEVRQSDGSVRKTNVFRHAGFVEAIRHTFPGEVQP